MGLLSDRQYKKLFHYAGRIVGRADAEDLLQTALLIAIEAGRGDLSDLSNRRWLLGVMKRRSVFDLRTMMRRRKREALYAAGDDVASQASNVFPTRFVASLPPALRTTALLALTGHSKVEIMFLLRLSDAALRQRFTEIRRRWRQVDGGSLKNASGLTGSLNFGTIRKSLLSVVRKEANLLASHDPDGHLFVIRTIPGCKDTDASAP